ncbi:MAG: UvrD-helicase domain-containing protein [Bacteriovoracaceae bacterium]|nr:UvrD-helicase domain-containing protein [Bacteriovoracaceae bacterium]
MSIREPNSEQKEAIEHEGGVLLSAGAGSGKTFVLVEHIVYLVKAFNEKNPNLEENEYLSDLRKYLSSIVMMTFTNKAAGELGLRLKKRFELETINTEDKEKWGLATKALEYMSVSTIHGFCFKLLRQGFFPEMSGEIEIISDAESTQRIIEIYNLWFEKNEKKLRADKPILFDILISHQSEIIQSLKGVFNSPDLRILWNSKNEDHSLKMSLDEHFKELMKLMELDSIFSHMIDLNSYNGQSESDWYLYLKKWKSVVNNNKEVTGEYLESLESFFNDNKGIKSPNEDEFPDVKEYMAKMIELRGFLTSHAEGLAEYETCRLTHLKDYQETVLDAFLYIEENYKLIQGLTFSDLEYYVLKGLNNESVCQRIRETYNYFIIDEFQDTSEVQYEIVERILSGDISKLFCVGDMKQAIYGFRGGELGVFKTCMDNIPSTKTMKNNYRSYSSVIDFNNRLFDDIFKKGFSYKGVDEKAVHVDFQNFPEGTENGEGALYKISSEVTEGQSKMKGGNTTHLDYAESFEILDQIEKISRENNEDHICILYRNLKPSTFLIGHMIEKGIGFTAQVKIPGGEDPLLGMFNLLLISSKSIENDSSTNAILKILNSYLQHLKITHINIDMSFLVQFSNDVKTLGLLTSFEKFVFNCGFSNSNHENNMKFVGVISSLAADNIDTALALLEDYLDDKYSLDFCYGVDSEKIIIMTVHASKGLEFDHVILGGIHSNGRYRAMDEYFGKIPGSFKWKKESNQKAPYVTPTYIKESLLEKKKNFSESKRLFYVAGTRAVKSISWVDLKGMTGTGKKKAVGPISYGGNGWVDGIRSFENSIDSGKIDILNKIKDKMIEREQCWDVSEDRLASISNIPPLFQRDSVGLYPRNKIVETESLLGNVSELSVTRLASLSQCPRKFYLGNILKFVPDEIDEWFEEINMKKDEEFQISESESVESSFTSSMASSAERGTRIHELMAHLVEHNLVIPRVLEDEMDKKCLEYGIKLLEKCSDSEFWAERLIKFPMFNFTISGTPDLMILKSDEVLEIWDYKTGRRKKETEKSYWFQLKAYANACYQLGFTSPTEKIKLSLIYLDGEERVDETVDKNTLEDWLFEYWRKLSNLNSKVEEHCQSCSFGKLCLSL